MSCVVDWVTGVTRLDNIMYVVCAWSSSVGLYNTDTYSPLDVVINVNGMNLPYDIVVCRDDRQLYVAEKDECIWRVSVDHHSYVKWLPTKSTTHRFDVWSLSLTSRRLLVTSRKPPSLHLYSTTDRQLLRVAQLPGYMKELYHGVETTRGTFVVGHRGVSQTEQQSAVSELLGYVKVLCHSLIQGRTGPPGCLAKARWAGAAVGRFDKNDNFKNL